MKFRLIHMFVFTAISAVLCVGVSVAIICKPLITGEFWVPWFIERLMLGTMSCFIGGALIFGVGFFSWLIVDSIWPSPPEPSLGPQPWQTEEQADFNALEKGWD